MSTYILEAKGLTKEFGGFCAVSGVDLQVTRGHVHALIGPNGAGKSTVFNLLTKFLQPTSGQITYNQLDITSMRPAEVARLGWSVPSRSRRSFRIFRCWTICGLRCNANWVPHFISGAASTPWTSLTAGQRN